MWTEVKRDSVAIDGGDSIAVYEEKECNGAVSKKVHLLIEDEGKLAKADLAENECIVLRDKLNEWFPTECKCGGKCKCE